MISRGRYGERVLGLFHLLYITRAWHYIALVYDAENVTVYRDGEAVAVRPATGAVTLGSDYKIRIGSELSYSRTFTRGLFDEFRIFDKALTQAEILTVYYAER